MSEASTDSRAPALFGHCVTAYEAMLAEATRVREGEVDMIIWEGFPTKLFRDQLRLSSPYYTSVFRALKAMECVRQLRRGGSSTPSQWELLQEPNLDKFLEVKDEMEEPSAADIRQESIEQTQRDLIRRVERLEAVTGLASVPMDYTTPPGGIKVIDVDDLDNTPGVGIVDG